MITLIKSSCLIVVCLRRIYLELQVLKVSFDRFGIAHSVRFHAAETVESGQVLTGFSSFQGPTVSNENRLDLFASKKDPHGSNGN